MFKLQQVMFAVKPIGVAGKRTIGTNHTVAGNHNGDRITAYGTTDSLRGATNNTAGDVTIGSRLSIRNLQQSLPHALLKEASSEVYWREIIRLTTREIEVKPTAGGIYWSNRFHHYVGWH